MDKTGKKPTPRTVRGKLLTNYQVLIKPKKNG